MILGGGSISDYSFSRAWGVNPSAASGTVVMDGTGGGGSGSFSLAVGDYVAYSFDTLATFYGIITETSENASSPTTGTVHAFTVMDNRIRLQWQDVFACFNMEDEASARRHGRPVAPSAPGNSSLNGADDVDMGSGLEPSGPLGGAGEVADPGDAAGVRRRYWSILPQHWASGIKTWHDAPFSAREILNFCFAGAWGDFGYTREYHPSLDDLVILGLDYTSGTKLSNLIADINGRAGLEVTIEGARTLVWGRKGEGVLPLPDDASDSLAAGEALTANDTKLRVVGEKIRVQVMNVELEPDWKSGWEKFIDELAWHREIATAFEMPTATKADHADISAFARQVTVYQYAKKKNDPSLLDYRRYGQGSRASMSAWMYIQDLVFRSYRIPPTKTLYGIPLSSLEMADTLIANTDIEGEGEDAKQVYAQNPVEYYPAAQATVIHKGQPLDLLNARDIRLFYRNQENQLRDQWSAASQFEVDPLNMSIRFTAPVFIDGLASEGKSLYLRLNRGEGGGTDLTSTVDEWSDYLDVIVPNPGCEISAASVRASFCFLIGPFHKDYGSGPRRGILPVSGLGLHLLDTKGTGGFAAAGTDSFAKADLTVPDAGDSTFREVLYEDGGKAFDKCDAAAAAALELSPVQATGGFTRHGSAGTPLTGVVDRVEIQVALGGGLTEQVSYTKARATGIPLAEKTLTRIQRTSELFPGQEELRKEVRQYRLMAAAQRGAAKGKTATTHRKFADVFAKPVGAENPSTRILFDKNSVAPTRDGVKGWKAGDIVWVDGKSVPSAAGMAFGGVLVSAPAMTGADGEEVQSKELMVAVRGVVPVRVRGTIAAGSSVQATRGVHYAGSSGDVGLGMLDHGDSVPVTSEASAEVLAMVSLGFGGSSSASGPCYFGEVITWEEDSSESESGKTGVRGGIIEAGEDQWWEPNHEIIAAPDREKLLWIELEILANSTSDGATVLSGIKSGNKAGIVWNEGDLSEGYPDKIIPPIFPPSGVTPGAGKIILPIGIIKSAGGAVTLQPAGCGHFVITHCPGALTYERRSSASVDSSSSA